MHGIVMVYYVVLLCAAFLRNKVYTYFLLIPVTRVIWWMASSYLDVFVGHN